MMTAAMQAQAQQQIADNVQKYSLMLCEALKQNYADYCIKNYGKSDADSLTDYVIESGRKYHKVIYIDSSGGRSVHAFVDKKTGEVYKSASWKSPAKGVRYDLRIIEQREWLLQHADWCGGYLYRN
jgi:hypothetical protein